MSEIAYRTVRSRRRTISIRIFRDGSVEVRCPMEMTRDRVHAFVTGKRSWIEKQLAAMPGDTQVLSEMQIRSLSEQAAPVIGGRVAHYAGIMGVTYGKITIRHQKTRWGSCSGKGNLNFNCLLMLTPPAVLDYVVVHELCHLKEMNHSARFWAEVESVLPNYQSSRKWLRDNGRALIAKLP